jgi:hypothetical protein
MSRALQIGRMRSPLGRTTPLGGSDPLYAEPGIAIREGLRELVDARILTLPCGVRAALIAAAALSHPTVDLVEQASSARGLAAAVETGLVRVDGGRVAFAHPLYASAVYETTARAGAGSSTGAWRAW